VDRAGVRDFADASLISDEGDDPLVILLCLGFAGQSLECNGEVGVSLEKVLKDFCDLFVRASP